MELYGAIYIFSIQVTKICNNNKRYKSTAGRKPNIPNIQVKNQMLSSFFIKADWYLINICGFIKIYYQMRPRSSTYYENINAVSRPMLMIQFMRLCVPLISQDHTAVYYTCDLYPSYQTICLSSTIRIFHLRILFQNGKKSYFNTTQGYLQENNNSRTHIRIIFLNFKYCSIT